jgi:ABC-2 type transport system permease protein
VASLVTAVFFWVIGLMELAVGADFGRLFRALSLLENLQELSKGVIDTGNLVFFASFIAFSLFLTQRTIESRRWR